MAEKTQESELTPKELKEDLEREDECQVNFTLVRTFKDVPVDRFVNGCIVIDWPNTVRKPECFNVNKGLVGCELTDELSRSSYYDFEAPEGTVGDLNEYRVTLDQTGQKLKVRKSFLEYRERSGIRSPPTALIDVSEIDALTDIISYEMSGIHCGGSGYMSIIRQHICHREGLYYNDQEYLQQLEEQSRVDDDDDDWYDRRDWD